MMKHGRKENFLVHWIDYNLSVPYIWCDAFQPANETFQFIAKITERQARLFSQWQNTRFINRQATPKSHKYFTEVSSGNVLHFSAVKTPDTIVEEPVTPTAIEIASVMFNGEIVSQIPCSATEWPKENCANGRRCDRSSCGRNTACQCVRPSIGRTDRNFKYNYICDVYPSMRRSTNCETYFICKSLKGHTTVRIRATC